MLNSQSLPEPIMRGIQGLRGLEFIDVTTSPTSASSGCWEIEVVVRARQRSSLVPEEPRFVVVVDNSYPNGSIKFFPAAAGSFDYTFPHQERNVLADHGRYRLGKLCLDSPVSRLPRLGESPDPVGNPDQRLAWYASRAKTWVEAAITNALMDPAEPFELPQVPFIDKPIQFRVIHDEGAETWPVWQKHLGATGRVEWRMLPGVKQTVMAARLMTSHGETIRECRRQFDVIGTEPCTGSWWLWPRPIVLTPWQAPSTWGELRQAGKFQGVDVDAKLQNLVKRHRGNKAVLLLLGYPIPDRWQGDAVEVHWQGISFPEIPEKARLKRGFRDNNIGRWQTLRSTAFANKAPLRYVHTSSWHPDRLQARGRMSPALTERSISIIGAGALGSTLAELLVRGGCHHVRVMDGDILEAGNLVRHVLSADALDRNKAEALVEHLRLAAPTASIEAAGSYLPTTEASVGEIFANAEVVCDCTGEDAVIRALSAPRWSLPKVFLSASLGYAARRLFLFQALGCSFPGEAFLAEVRPWIEAERGIWRDNGETLEGAGCWSPLFPARIDDVWLAAVATVKHLERMAAAESATHARLWVLEQMDVGAGFRYLDNGPDSSMETT